MTEAPDSIAASENTPSGCIGLAAILAHPGPAAILDARGRVIAANSRGRGMADLFHPDHESALQGVMRAVLASGVPAMKSVEVRRGGPVGCLDLMFLPTADRSRLAVLGRDSSLEANLRSALAESRQRYKDFVDLSSDFIWETGTDGRFVFISPGGALGFDATDLVGADPATLVDPAAGPEAAAVFLTRDRIKDREVWTRRKDGTAACLVTSAMPVLGKEGQWIGARGVCQDVTEQRERDHALNRARNRERILTHVVRSFRDEMDPANMLNVAAESLARGLGTEACQIFRAIPGDDSDPPEFVLRGSFGVTPGQGLDSDLLADLLGSVDGGGALRERQIGGWHILIAAARYRRRVNGAVVLSRTIARGSWTDDDRLLIMDIANQIGIANEQIGQHERIITMSRTDSLTGLLNRRAFFEDVERRLKRMERSPQPGALLYIDLDNFKLVNDVHGHSRGDEALLVVKDILTSRTRPSDLIARLGGDEFAVWLDGVGPDAALAKAHDFLAQVDRLAAFSGDPARPLTMSIGLAVHDPDTREDLDAFTARADGAMYQSKNAGKGTVRVAEPPTSCRLPRTADRPDATPTPDDPTKPSTTATAPPVRTPPP